MSMSNISKLNWNNKLYVKIWYKENTRFHYKAIDTVWSWIYDPVTRVTSAQRLVSKFGKKRGMKNDIFTKPNIFFILV